MSVGTTCDYPVIFVRVIVTRARSICVRMILAIGHTRQRGSRDIDRQDGRNIDRHVDKNHDRHVGRNNDRHVEFIIVMRVDFNIVRHVDFNIVRHVDWNIVRHVDFNIVRHVDFNIDTIRNKSVSRKTAQSTAGVSGVTGMRVVAITRMVPLLLLRLGSCIREVGRRSRWRVEGRRRGRMGIGRHLGTGEGGRWGGVTASRVLIPNGVVVRVRASSLTGVRVTGERICIPCGGWILGKVAL